MLPRIIFIVLLLWIYFSCNRGNNIKEKDIIIQWKNKIVAIGNPLHKPKIKESYIKNLTEKEEVCTLKGKQFLCNFFNKQSKDI